MNLGEGAVEERSVSAGGPKKESRRRRNGEEPDALHRGTTGSLVYDSRNERMPCTRVG
jgi:hypothetical protein